MNQKEIKLPIACSRFLQILWGVGVVAALIIGFPIKDMVGLFLVALGVTGLLIPGIFYYVSFAEWLREKPRLPFKFSCKCEDEKK
jgi:predicted membrane channel-forming protein YqfA (hemolysin III family)